MPAIVNKLGPGTLKVGETGTEIDFTCQVTAARVEWEVDAEDAVQVLCGDSVPGARTYSAVLTGSVLNDMGATVGIIEFSWANKGTTQPFTFHPSTNTGVKQVTGELIVDPLSIGGDEVGQNMTSDFEWACVGEPDLEAPTVTGAGVEGEGARSRRAAA